MIFCFSSFLLSSICMERTGISRGESSPQLMIEENKFKSKKRKREREPNEQMNDRISNCLLYNMSVILLQNQENIRRRIFRSIFHVKKRKSHKNGFFIQNTEFFFIIISIPLHSFILILISSQMYDSMIIKSRGASERPFHPLPHLILKSITGK